jgi:hypothetical protein
VEYTPENDPIVHELRVMRMRVLQFGAGLMLVELVVIGILWWMALGPIGAAAMVAGTAWLMWLTAFS